MWQEDVQKKVEMLSSLADVRIATKLLSRSGIAPPRQPSANTDSMAPQHITPQHTTTSHRNTPRQRNATHHDTTQHSTTQHNTTQHNMT